MEFLEADKSINEIEEVISSTVKSEMRKARLELPANSSIALSSGVKMKPHDHDSDHEDEEEVKGIEGVVVVLHDQCIS